MASIKFDITGNANGFVQATRQAENAAKGMVGKINDEAHKLDDMFKKLATSASSFFAFQQVNNLKNKIVEVRGEFQQLEIAFGTMLQSESKGMELMSQLTDTAARTPFDLQGVANGAKQLLAYGTSADEVNDTLVMLGNIASGLSIPLNDLVYLYGTTMTQGRLFTQDLRQFQGRGIPLADELAAQLNVSKDAIGDMVTAGKIGFPEVQKALVSMTSEGGKFYQLMEKQSSSLTGMMSNLEDSIDMMFNEIGTKMQGTLGATINLTSTLVENYEKIGKSIATVVSIFGTYKAAVVAVNAIQKVGNKLNYIAEAQALEVLLSAEQKEQISKKGLSKTSAQYAAIVKQEVAANVEAATVAKAKAVSDAQAAKANVASKREELVTSQALVTKRKEELATAIASGNAKKIEAAQRKLNAASSQREAATIALTSAKKDYEAKQTAVVVAAKQAEKATTDLNTASKAKETTATTILTAAKLKLASATKAVNTALKANQFALIAAAVMGLVYGLVKLVTYQTEAEKAQKKLDEAFEKTQQSIDSERIQLDRMFGRLKAAKEGTEEYEAAKDAIYKKYGSYLSKLGDETTALNDVAAAYKLIADEAAKAARARALDTIAVEQSDILASKQGDIKERLRKELEDKFGNTVGEDGVSLVETYYWKIVPVIEGREEADAEVQGIIDQMDRRSTYKESMKGAGRTTNPVENLIKEATKAREQYNAAMEAAESKFGERETDKSATTGGATTFDATKASLESLMSLLPQAKKELEALKKADQPDEAAIAKKEQEIQVMQKEILQREKQLSTIKEVKEQIKKLQDEQENYSATSKEYLDIEKRIQALQKKLPKTQKQEATEENKAEKADQKVADTKADNAKTELRNQEDLDNQREQAEINALADGGEKRRRQMALNHAMEMQQIKRQQEDFIDAAVARDKALFDAEEDAKSAKDTTGTYKKATFDEDASRKKHTAAAETAFKPIYEKTEAKQRQEEAKELKAINDEILGDFKTYEQQRQDVEDKYAKLESKFYKKDENGEFVKDAQGNKVFEEGVDEGNIAELNRAKDEDLAAIDEAFAQRSATYQGWLDYISDMSLKRLKEQLTLAEQELAVAEAEAEESGSPNTENISIARAKVNTLQNKLPKKKVETNLDKRSIDEWKDLKDALEDCIDAFDEIGDSIGGVTGEVISSTGSIMASSLSMVNGIMTLVETFSSGAIATATGAAKAIQIVETASVILTVISLAFQIVMKIIEAVKNMADADNQAEIDTLTAANEKLDQSYKDLEKDIDKAYSVDASNLIAQQNELLEQKKKNLELMIAEEEAKKNSDPEQIKQWEEDIDDIEDNIEENADKAKEAITGISFDDFRSKFLDALMDMEEGANGFAEDIEDSIREAMYNSLLSNDEFEKEMQGLYDDLSTAIESNDASEIARIKQQIYDLYDEQEAKARKIDEKIGYEASSTREAASKGIAQASQSSVDDLNGRMTAIQSHTFSINQNLASVVAINAQILGRVSSIDGHTSRLEAIENSLSYMRSDISDILTKGIRVKA